MFRPKSTLERTFDALLGHEMRRLNMHLPRQRKTLNELLKWHNPTLEANDGSMIVLRSTELEELAKIVPPEFRDTLKIPIVLLRRMDLGKSIYTVTGGKLDHFVIRKILGLTEAGFQHLYLEDENAYLYKPQVSDLLSRFHSLIVVAFSIPRELTDHYQSRD